MIVDELKKRITQAMKERDELAKDVLRVALGEIQTMEHRRNAALPDEEAVAIVRKLVKSNEETLALSGEGDRAATLRRENEILKTLLPQTMSVDAILAALAPLADAIRAAKSDGQANGIAIKHLKSTGAAFESGDATAAVKQLRA